MNITEISNYLINHESIININSFFEYYIIEIKQPNNCITKLFNYDKYNFEEFMKKLKNFNLSNALIKIKLNDKILRIKSNSINELINNYYTQAIDIIIIFYSNSILINPINLQHIENKYHYYKYHYIIHCQNIRNLNLDQKIDINTYEKMKIETEEIKLKNLKLSQELETINQKYNKYLKLSQELESKLKEITRINNQLNEKILTLENENKKIKGENDDLYISIINGFDESKKK